MSRYYKENKLNMTEVMSLAVLKRHAIATAAERNIAACMANEPSESYIKDLRLELKMKRGNAELTTYARYVV